MSTDTLRRAIVLAALILAVLSYPFGGPLLAIAVGLLAIAALL